MLAQTVDAKVKTGDTLILLPEKDSIDRYTVKWRSDQTETPTETRRILGDANCDGHVTIIDTTAIQRRIASLTVANFDMEAACVSRKELSILDATLIQRWLVDLSAPEGIGQPL